MDLHLQFGYGMMDHSRTLVDAWGEGTVILSPRDLSATQLRRLASSIRRLSNGRILLDPQFYLPDADHQRLTSHAYWPDEYATGDFWAGEELRRLLRAILSENQTLGCEEVILPGIYADRVDDDWVAKQNLIVEEAGELFGVPLYVTVALGADAISSNADVDEVLAAAETWSVHGVYLVAEHPRGEYLVSDAAWMANLLDLVAGLRLKGKRVIVGYCNHQMMILASAGANAIASGTWMNVRSFPPVKFRAQYDDEVRQRAVWYYAPAALSEFKIPFLDIAQKRGVLHLLAPPTSFPSPYAAALFSGSQPSSVRWTEQSAFRHYLSSLKTQVEGARHDTFEKTAAEHAQVLDAADRVLQELHGAEVRGQMRDFSLALDASRAALGVLKATRGGMLRRKWPTL